METALGNHGALSSPTWTKERHAREPSFRIGRVKIARMKEDASVLCLKEKDPAPLHGNAA